MAEKKPTIRKPIKKAASKTLMGNQDLKRGDSMAGDKVPFSMKIQWELLDEARQYARERGTSVSRLIVDGLRWRLKQD